MPSPFPGMNPYLEAPDLWSGFHHDLASVIRRQIAPRLWSRYYTDIEIKMHHTEADEVRIIAPDVSVVRTRRRAHSELMPASPVATTLELPPAPFQYAIPVDPPEKSYSVNIYDAENNVLVTAIEILSPANKRAGHDAYFQYRRKRQRLLLSEAHLIEIDLLRGGERLPFDRPLPNAPYVVSLSRANKRPKADLWLLPLQDPIPLLPVPLLHPDPDVPLDLSAAVMEIYELGAYDLRIDYTIPPPPPALSLSAQQWLDAHLRSLNLR